MNKVAKNAFWIIICKIIQGLMLVISNVLVTRYLGPSKYGILTYASALVSFISPLIALGINEVLVKEFISYPDKAGVMLGTSIFLSSISSVLSIIIIILFSLCVGNNDIVTIIFCMIFSCSLLFYPFEHIKYLFQAKYLSKYASLSVMIASLVASLYKMLLIICESNIIPFALASIIEMMLSTLLYFGFLKAKIGTSISISLSYAKSILSKSKYYIFSAMLVTIFAQTDKIMLKLMRGEHATGLYGAATYCAEMTIFVFGAIIDSFRPYILEGKEHSNALFEKRITMLYSIIIYLSIAQSIILTCFSKYIILILFGQGYTDSSTTLSLASCFMIFAYIGAVRNIWILANCKQKYLWLINLIGAITNIILNSILIPVWDIEGAAIASLITNVITNVLTGFLLSSIRRNNYLILESLNPKLILNLIQEYYHSKRAIQ